MERRIAPSATTAGVNGDFFSFETGRAERRLMREGQVASPPYGVRSSAGVTTDGTLDIRRISFFGTWQGAGAKARLVDLQRAAARPTGSRSTPRRGGRRRRRSPAPRRRSCSRSRPRSRMRISRRRSSRCARGGAARADPARRRGARRRGSAAAALAAEAPVGQQVTTRLIFKPDWPGRRRRRSEAAPRSSATARPSSAPVRRSRRASSRRGRPAPASASSPTGASSSSRSTAASPGYSVGMTNFELAQTLVRLGAVTAMALDGGGSTTMAFDGSLLNRPSRAGAADLDGAHVPVHRRVRAAGGLGRVAGRRRRRRPPEPALQGRAPVDRRPSR